MLDVDLGFRPSNAIAVRVDPDAQYDTREKRLAYIDEVLRRTRALPGVEAAGITDALPLGRNRTWGARAKGVTYERGRAPSAFPRIVSDGYPAAMGIPLKAGRDISPHDTATRTRSSSINETMARTLWPGQDPIGKIVLNACSPERRVSASSATCAISRSSSDRATRCTSRSGSAAIMPTTDLVVRSSQRDRRRSWPRCARR